MKFFLDHNDAPIEDIPPKIGLLIIVTLIVGTFISISFIELINSIKLDITISPMIRAVLQFITLCIATSWSAISIYRIFKIPPF